jgi:hypothetical protein
VRLLVLGGTYLKGKAQLGSLIFKANLEADGLGEAASSWC